MQKTRVLSYFALAIFLFTLLNLPMNTFSFLQSSYLITSELFANKRFLDEDMELLRLRLEVNTLKEQLSYVKSWLNEEGRVEDLITRVEEMTREGSTHRYEVERLKNLLSKESSFVLAKVIARDPAFWSSGFWVDKGSYENKELQSEVICKNSPVLVGSSLIGVVEEVEPGRAYVRLITDASLTPSVRVCRGSESDFRLSGLLSQLEDYLKLDDRFAKESSIFQAIRDATSLLDQEEMTKYLAKGELRGSSYPLWRNRRQILQGIGFNYDFSDVEGASKELHRKMDIPLIKEGDLLVTTGLDGVFPAGIDVAFVKKIFPLKEGSFFYELEAEPSVGSLDEIKFVQILPPIIRSS